MNSFDRRRLDPEAQAAIALFEQAPVGQQLSDFRERPGRCWRSATRFVSALRESGTDGDLLAWTGKGWEHGAIQLRGAAIVVDWTASQFEHEPAKAQQYPQPWICSRADADARWGCSEILDFEDPFFRGAGRNLVPEPVLPWTQARERIEGIDSPQACRAPARSGRDLG